jgi:hypothetical protein
MPERRHLAELPETGAVETIEDPRVRTLGSAGKLDDIKMLGEKLITDVMKFER